MGGSYSSSDEGESYQRQTASQLKACYHASLSAYRVQQYEAPESKEIFAWRKSLRRILVAVECKAPHWDRFKKSFLEFITLEDDDSHVEWIANAQLIKLSYPNYASQFMAQDLFARGSIGSQKEDPDILVQCQQPPQTGILQTHPVQTEQEYDEEEKQTKASMISRVNHVKRRKQMFLDIMTHTSARKDMRENLLTQVNTPNHVVVRLIAIFHEKFQEFFEKQINSLDETGYSAIDEETYKSTCDLVKCLVKVLKHFINWLYKKMIIQFGKILKEQDLEPDYIVDSVIYQLIFQDSRSAMNQLLKKLLRRRYKQEIKQFHSIIEKTKFKKLEDFDTYLKSSTLFLIESDPYEEVTGKLSGMRKQASPYAKFEDILSLEREMMKSLMKYHRNSLNMKIKVRKNFGMDIKAPVLTYCLVKSDNLDLVIDKAIVEEFVNKDYQNDTPQFSAFVGCLEALINGQSYFKDIKETIPEEDCRSGSSPLPSPNLLKGKDNLIKVYF